MGEKKAPDVDFQPQQQEVEGYRFTKTQIIIAVVVAIAVIVAVGLIAGLAPRGTSANQGQGQGTQGTTPATMGTGTATSAGGSSSTPMKPTNMPSMPPYKVPTPKPTAPKPTSSVAALKSIRLPTEIKPIQYTFSLVVNLTTLTFTGDTVIEINVTAPTRNIILHAADMKMTKDPTVSDNNKFDQSTTYSPISQKGFYAPNQYYYIFMQQDLTANKIYYLRFQHSANLSTSLDGLYKYKYKLDNGITYWGVGSQCEPFDARRIIPCFDEPAMKAKFTPLITTNDNVSSVLTNTHVRRLLPAGSGQESAEFHTSVVMSSYLLAFSITDFAEVSNRTKFNTLVKVWSRKDRVNAGLYALKAAVAITEFFEEILQVNYSLPKQDHVAVPKFDAGAMENWGLILYREEYLLYNETYTDAREKEFVVAIIAHELAHMWFGNLVTMEWWNNLWLNEAFASLFEYYGMERVDSSFKAWDSFIGYDWRTALGSDQTPFSHPIVPPYPGGPFFDRITYQKGASVLRMLREDLDTVPFFNGLTAYLKKYSYKNAVAVNLFDVMSQATGQNINEKMEGWVYQMGYPILTVKRHSSDANLAVITQQRYLSNKTLNPATDPSGQIYKSKYGYKWNISVTANYNGGPSTPQRKVLSATANSIELIWPENGWIKVNVNSQGLYRVMYDIENWNELAKQMNADAKAFKPADTAGLIYDALSFAESDRLSYDTAFSLTNYLRNENEYVPWYVTWAYFLGIQRRLAARTSYQYFSQYYMKILKPQVDAIGFTGDGAHTKRLLRETIMDAACYQGYEPCVTNAGNMLKAYMNSPDNNPVPADLREVVYRYGIMYGGSMAWDFLWMKYYNSINLQERDKIFYALSFSRDPPSIRRFLDYSMDKNKIDPGSTLTVFSYLSRNPVARPILWAYVVEKKDAMKKRFGNLRTPSYYASLYFDSDYRLMQVKTFFMMNPENTYASVSREKATIANIEGNKRWLMNNEKKLVKAFKAQLM